MSEKNSDEDTTLNRKKRQMEIMSNGTKPTFNKTSNRKKCQVDITLNGRNVNQDNIKNTDEEKALN